MAHGRKVGRFKLKVPSQEAAKKYLFQWRSDHLYHRADQFPRLNQQDLFGTPGLLNLEIGCGTGEYLTDLAVQNPEKVFLGIDTSRRAIFFAVDLAAQRELNNIKFIMADAKLLYPLLVPDSLEGIIFHFPDPNYGGKNRKLRIFDREFLDHFYAALAPGGTLSMVTDEEEFFFEALNIAEQDANFTKAHRERYLDHFDPPVKSRFHRAWQRFDKPIFRLILKKT